MGINLFCCLHFLCIKCAKLIQCHSNFLTHNLISGLICFDFKAVCVCVCPTKELQMSSLLKLNFLLQSYNIQYITWTKIKCISPKINIYSSICCGRKKKKNHRIIKNIVLKSKKKKSVVSKVFTQCFTANFFHAFNSFVKHRHKSNTTLTSTSVKDLSLD